jgi:transposase
VLCSGAPWQDLPERYGKWKTVYERFRRYRIEGFFDQIPERLHLNLNEQGLIDFHLWQADSTTIRAQKSAVGAGLKRGIHCGRMNHRIMRQEAAEAVFPPGFTGFVKAKAFPWLLL